MLEGWDDAYFMQEPFMPKLKAPFPYIGGKSTVSSLVWSYFGNTHTYIEPFAGSLAVLLGRPSHHLKEPRREIVNDLNGFVVNAWRAIQMSPKELASFIQKNCPVFELDLQARQKYLVSRESDLLDSLKSDYQFYDLEIAAHWISGMSAHILGSDFPSSNDNRRPYVRGHGKGVHSPRRFDDIYEIFDQLSFRLRQVKIFCGGWERSLTPSVMEIDKGTPTSIFLDPPYTGDSGRGTDLYHNDDLEVGHQVFEWCLDHANDPNIRIALCGLEGEYRIPDDWITVHWKAIGGTQYADKERIWFSPHCLKPTEGPTGILTTFVSSDPVPEDSLNDNNDDHDHQ